MAEPTPGALLTPSLRLTRHLARGSMGSLWLAQHERFGAEVVVKFLFECAPTSRIDLARFEREATVLASVHSPHVVRYLEHGVSADGAPFLVLERLEGYDLAVALRRHGPLGPAHVAVVLEQVAQALATIHGAGVVHRDVKPSNIFLCGGLRHPPFVKLLDFGIAKCLRSGEPLTSTGQLVGTPHFMSPEQLKAQPVDHRADLWALGVVAYRALTGQMPFAGETLVEVVMQAVAAHMVPPSSLHAGLPPAVDRWMERACAPDPDARFATAEAMAGAFWDALGPGARQRAVASGLAPAAWGVSTTLGASAVSSSRDAPTSGASVPPIAPSLPGGAGGRRRRRGGPWAFGAVAGAAVLAFGWGARGRLLATQGRAPETVAPLGTAAASPEAAGAALAPMTADSAAAPPATAAPAGRAACPAGMASLGGAGAPGDALVPPPAFCLDAHEVTVDDYGACVREGACSPAGVRAKGAPAIALAKAKASEASALGGGDGEGAVPRAVGALCTAEQPGRDRHPINCVDWEGADAFCRRAGKRLPKADEWEFAVRGGGGRTYPWGEEPPSANHLNGCGGECARWGARHRVALVALYADDDGFHATAPVGSFPRGRSVEGVDDLLGNVMEWAADGGEGPAPVRVVMGSAWDVSSPSALRTPPRATLPATARSHLVGFRCAATPGRP